MVIIFAVLIIPKWLMIPDGFQYFLDDFWNFQKNHQIWTHAPRSCHTNASKQIRKYGGIINKYVSYLIILEIQNVQIC